MDPENGEIYLQDRDDLQRMNQDTLSIMIRLSDPFGLFTDKEVELDLTKWTYFAGRLQIPDLSLKVPENLPVGSTIHSFPVSDVYGSTKEYFLVSGSGDDDNHLFQIDQNGNLKTASTFDYEDGNTELQIRLQVLDSQFDSVQKSITISVTDLYVPNVQTGQPKICPDHLQLDATFSPIDHQLEDLEFGFYLSPNPIDNVSSDEVQRITSTSSTESSFVAKIPYPKIGGSNYYYLAFAESSEGTSYGLEKSFTPPSVTPWEIWRNGSYTSYDNWWQSEWFGAFYTAHYPWIFHQNLGWVYIKDDIKHGMWLYRKGLGWVWTSDDIFPFIFIYDQGRWFYLHRNRSKTTLYDFELEDWFESDEQ